MIRNIFSQSIADNVENFQFGALKLGCLLAGLRADDRSLGLFYVGLDLLLYTYQSLPLGGKQGLKFLPLLCPECFEFEGASLRLELFELFESTLLTGLSAWRVYDGAPLVWPARAQWQRTVGWMTSVSPYGWHWIETHARRACADGGRGRVRDRAEFEADFCASSY